MEQLMNKLKEHFENTIEIGLMFDGNIKKMEYYNLFCKAASKDQLYKIFSNNLCMFNCSYNNNDSILMLFSIPINIETSSKNIAERVIEIVDLLEKTFITLDFLRSEEVREDKVVYITCIKKIS